MSVVRSRPLKERYKSEGNCCKCFSSSHLPSFSPHPIPSLLIVPYLVGSLFYSVVGDVLALYVLSSKLEDLDHMTELLAFLDFVS